MDGIGFGDGKVGGKVQPAGGAIGRNENGVEQHAGAIEHRDIVRARTVQPIIVPAEVEEHPAPAIRVFRSSGRIMGGGRADVVQIIVPVVDESPAAQGPILNRTGPGAGGNIPDKLTERQVRVGKGQRGGEEIVGHDVAGGLEMSHCGILVIRHRRALRQEVTARLDEGPSGGDPRDVSVVRLQEQREASVGSQIKVGGHRVVRNAGKKKKVRMKICIHGIDRHGRPELEFVANIHHGIRDELVHRNIVTKSGDERTR